jgi:hypothetical protein
LQAGEQLPILLVDSCFSPRINTVHAVKLLTNVKWKYRTVVDSPARDVFTNSIALISDAQLEEEYITWQPA